jgi:hypothetical protein
LPSLFSSMPGLTLRAFCNNARNNFGFSPSTLKTPPLTSTENLLISQSDPQLNIMTWNLGLGPDFMAATNGLKNAKKRINKIVEIIEKANANIVNLQEIFSSPASDE